MGRRRQPVSRISTRAFVVSTVLAVVAGYGGWGVTPALAASLSGSSFEIDSNANLVVDSGGDDWAGVSALVKPDKPSGGGDDSFTQGTQENDATTTVASGSIPPSKSDLKHFGLYVERPAAGGVYLNVFWTRVQDPSGTTNMDFEFNQSGVVSNNGSPQVIPVRTVGDLLLTYDLTNGGAVATLSKRLWNGTSWGPAVALGGNAIGSINSSAISAASSAGLGALDPRTFGEASVDLLKLLPVADGCVTYGSVYLKSRASASFNAELKDFIAPMAATVSNCGAIKIHKTDENGPLAGASFTLYKDAAPVGGSRGAEDTVVAGACGPTDSAGDCTVEDVKKGDYWVVETTVPAGHDAAPDQHATISAGDDVVSLTFDDPIQKGTLVVVKDAQPDDPKDFSFTVGSSSFSLDDDNDATLPSSKSFTLPVGAHTVTEGVTAGWTLTAISCTNPGGASPNLQTRSVAPVIQKGVTTTCTFTNVANPKDAGLTTDAVHASGDAWNDTASLTGDGSHDVTGSVTFFACAPTTTATACTSGGTQVGTAVAVTGSGTSFGATTSTAYTPPSAGWTCFRAEFASTSAFYNDDTHTNDTTECFLTQRDDLTVSKSATPAFSRAYTWGIGKSVDASNVTIPAGGGAVSTYTVSVTHSSSDGGWVVTGGITVSNPNADAFTGVTVTDAIDNGGTCVVTGGTNVTVPAKDSVTLPYTCTYASAPSPAAGTNTATVTWDGAKYFTTGSSAKGTAGVDFSDVSPATTDASVQVTDSLVGSLGTVTASDPSPRTFTYTIGRSGVPGTCTTYPNTASYVTSTSQSTGSSSAAVRLCVGADLTAAMTATGSYEQTDLWLIDKAVDRTSATVENGQTATFTYTVTATPSGAIESNQAMTGTVTVTNPNDWEAVSADVTVASDLGGGETCTVTGGTAVSVPASGAVELPWSCSYTGAPSHSGTVAATVTWNQAAASTPSGSTSASTAATLALTVETNASVAVTDDKTDPANPVLLGTADWNDLPTTFTYDVDKTASGSACATYTNTAVIVQTDQSASAEVQVCGFTGGGGTVTPPPPSGGGGLPFTGDRTGLLVRLGGLLLAGGLVLLLVSRRRAAS